MSIPATSNLKQATGPTKTAGLTRYDATSRALPGSREDRVIHWLRGVSRDSRIGVLHRFALLGIGLHRRRDEPDAVASQIGVDRATVLRAVDVGVRRGWLGRDGRGYVLLCGGPHAACAFHDAETLEFPRTTYARACEGYDEEFERQLVDEIARAIATASRVTDTNAMVIRIGETASALLTALASILAMSPALTRSTTAIRKTLDELGKRLRRRITAAESDSELQDFVARCFRGSDVGGHA